MMKKLLLCAAMVGLGCTASYATPTRFTFTDPAFGGNPLNASYILNMVESQKQIQEETPAGANGTGKTSLADSFQEQLQARLLSALASQITGQIYGTDKPVEGTYVVGDLKIIYRTVGDNVEIVLNDGSGDTIIKVPKITDPTK